MMKWLTVLLIALCSASALAGVKEDKARKLFEVQGIERDWQTSMDEGKVRNKKQAREMLDQMLAQFDLDKTYKARLDRAADRFITNMQSDRTAKDFLDVLIPIYASQFTEMELDQLIEFYNSPVGRKDAEVSKEAMKKAAAQFEGENQKIRIEATNQFVKDLQLIAQECNCRKKRNKEGEPL